MAYNPYRQPMLATPSYQAMDYTTRAAQDAWNAQQNAAVAHNQATNAGVVAIQQEIAQNEAEISKLKTELSQLTAQYGDADAMDRMLAANRARIGDMGNSLAHQQAINNRFQFQWANKDKVKNQAKAVEKDIVDAYREYAYAEDLKSKQVAAYNIKTKLDEYKELTGKAWHPWCQRRGHHYGRAEKAFPRPVRPPDKELSASRYRPAHA